MVLLMVLILFGAFFIGIVAGAVIPLPWSIPVALVGGYFWAQLVLSLLGVS